MNLSKEFILAFNFAMKFEIGPWFDPNNPDVIAGLCDTQIQQRMVGYCNIAGDSGGLTKYGIAQNPNPDIDVKNLNLSKAMEIYFNRYWLAGGCDKITIPVTVFQFDMCVNHGIGRAAKTLQQAVGAVADGQIGPATLGLVNKQNPIELINKLSVLRENRYRAIVENNPSQGKFLNGWLRRVTEVTQYSLDQLK